MEQTPLPKAEPAAGAGDKLRSVDGMLLVDKPAGMTSHDVVEIARRAYGERSIGHLGTLDPFATGLLALLLGKSTRLASFLVAEPKVYLAEIRFGSETDTDDDTGAVTKSTETPARVNVAKAIKTLTGEISQVPPDYSAKNVDGMRAYKAARKGKPVAQLPVRVTVHSWEIEKQTSEALVATITCSGGTYIRALARDLGRLAGSAAHLASLRRLAMGSLHVKDALTIDQLKAADRPPLRLAVKIARD